METSPPPIAQPPYESQPSLPPKKGMGTGAKIGIGCGAIVLLLIIAAVVAGLMLGPKLKQFSEDAQKDPTRAMATTMSSVSGGKLQIVAEDQANKRYTLKDPNGKLTTIYWDDAKKAPVTIEGDFSAIPAPAVEPAAK